MKRGVWQTFCTTRYVVRS